MQLIEGTAKIASMIEEENSMIFTECVYCSTPFAVSLDDSYLTHMAQGRQLITSHVCENCNKTNYVEHKRINGETFGEEDERAKRLYV